MKKLYSILLLVTFLIQTAGNVFASELVLSDTTYINSVTENCYAKVTDDEFHGDSGYSLHLYTKGDHLEISQKFTQALTAGKYTLTWYGKGTGKLWYYQNWGTEWTASFVDGIAQAMPDGWTRYQREINVDGKGDTSFLFHSDGAVDCYIDDISLVDENGIDYVIDGGFEEVTVVGGGDEPSDGEEPDDSDIPDENLTLSDTTKVEGTQNENRYAKVTDNEKNSGNYSLHIYSTAAGFEFGQSYTVANLPAGSYTVTWYAKGNDGTMSFWSNWGEYVYNTNITPTVQTNGWKKYTASITIDGSGDKNFLFYTDSAVDCYIDDISLVDENGINYIIDGGFEEVTVAGGGDEPDDPGEPDDPNVPDDPNDEPEKDEDDDEVYKPELILSDTTKISGSNGDFCYAEASGDEFRGGEGYSIHIVSSGDANFTVSQTTTETCVAGESYLLTVYAKPVKGRVWFRVGWGDDAWMVAAEDGIEQPDGWKKYEKTITIGPENTTDFFFYSDQETECYIDDISLVKVGTDVNIIPDGDFSEVTAIEPVLPDYTVSEPVLRLGSDKVDAVAQAGEYTVSAKIRNFAIGQGLPVEMLVAVFDQTGEMVSLYSVRENVPKTDLTQDRTKLSVSFNAEAGYTLDVYLINNRQDIDTYRVPAGF